MWRFGERENLKNYGFGVWVKVFVFMFVRKVRVVDIERLFGSENDLMDWRL